jgi:hypothetical protein
MFIYFWGAVLAKNKRVLMSIHKVGVLDDAGTERLCLGQMLRGAGACMITPVRREALMSRIKALG